MKLLDIVTGAWAIQPEKLAEIQDIYGRHLKGDKIDIAGIEAQLGRPLQNREQGYENVRGVAIIPVDGVIAKRMNLFSQISGGASTELIGRDFKEAMADPDVKSILLEIDSPGGTVDGTSELARLIHDMRGEKPVVVWANGLMASAAYWIGSAADQVYISGDTTIVGSIGVITQHVDYSKQDDLIGMKRTNIFAGKYKAVGADNNPLSEEDRSVIQARLDYTYSIFVETVAKHRGVDVKTVLDNMAEGKLFTGQQAVEAGLVDGASTRDALIAALSDGELPDPFAFSAGVLTKIEKEKLVAALEADLEETAKYEIEQEDLSMSGKPEITKGSVLEHAPAVAEAFREEGKASVDVEAIKAEAAKAENDRIQSVLAQSVPGCEALIKEMAFDGKTTGPEAAVKVLQAIKGKQSSIAANLHADGADLTKIKPSADNSVEEGDEEEEEDEDAPVEEKAEAAWNKDAKIRAEFVSLEHYTAYVKAEAAGRVKSLNRRTA